MSEIAELFAELLKDITYEELVQIKAEAEEEARLEIERTRKIPSIDIVRCQDCKYWVYNFNGCARNPCTEPWYATDGCTYGEREGE